jgi:hypothetical protein
MKSSIARTLLAAALALPAVPAIAADEDTMLGACRARAASTLKISPDAVSVKYEGQRTDKSHAVNGTANVKGVDRTFQCSFNSKGEKITRWVLNPAPKATKAATPGNDDKAADASRRAGMGQFDATGKVPCAQAKGQPTVPCDFGVARAGGGTATVVITRPDGRKRVIFFDKGKANSADTSQADGYGKFTARKQADLYFIQVGDERYEIPEAAVFGG